MENTLEFKVARIHKIATAGRMKAFVDLNINDVIVLKGIRIVEGKNGLFVSMPQEKGKDNKWYDTIRCLSQDVRSQIAENILNAYQKE